MIRLLKIHVVWWYLTMLAPSVAVEFLFWGLGESDPDIIGSVAHLTFISIANFIQGLAFCAFFTMISLNLYALIPVQENFKITVLAYALSFYFSLNIFLAAATPIAMWTHNLTWVNLAGWLSFSAFIAVPVIFYNCAKILCICEQQTIAPIKKSVISTTIKCLFWVIFLPSIKRRTLTLLNDSYHGEPQT